MGKARTVGAKKRSRAGRPRIAGERTPSGQLSRSATAQEERAQEVMGAVIDIRARLYDVAPEIAKRPECGYVLGRIYLDGKLGEIAIGKEGQGLAEMRLEAGKRYAEAMARYYGLTGVPFPSARAQNLFSVPGDAGEVSQSRAEAARKAADTMMRLESALLSCTQGRHVATTVKNICLLDIDEARGWPPHMMEFLKQGLDALVWQFGLEKEAKPL